YLGVGTERRSDGGRPDRCGIRSPIERRWSDDGFAQVAADDLSVKDADVEVAVEVGVGVPLRGARTGADGVVDRPEVRGPVRRCGGPVDGHVARHVAEQAVEIEDVVATRD